MPVIADVVLVNGVPINGATVNAYKASRFAGVPALNAGAPGAADAGPVTSGPSFGGAGNFQITVPTDEDYYCSATTSAGTSWQFYPAVENADLVHLAGVETVTGAKTFSGGISLGSQKITSLANGTAATDGAAFGQVPFVPAHPVGYYQTFSSGAALQNSVTLSLGNYPLCAPLFLPAGTYDKIGINVTGAGSAGTKIRLGIYASGADGMPGTLASDCGQVAGDAVAYAEIAALNLTLAMGRYWLAACLQAVGATAPATTNTSGDMTAGVVHAGGSTLATNNIQSLVLNPVASGPYPATATLAGGGSGAMPRIVLHRSA